MGPNNHNSRPDPTRSIPAQGRAANKAHSVGEVEQQNAAHYEVEYPEKLR